MKSNKNFIKLILPICFLLISCTQKHEPGVFFDNIPKSWNQPLPEMEEYTGFWWESLQDTLFNDYFELFRENNPDLRSTYYQLDVAKNNATIKSAGIFPNASLNNSSSTRMQNLSGFGFDPSFLGIGGGDSTGSSQSNVISFESDLFNLNLGFQWELDIWGKLFNARKSAWTEFNASANDLAYAQFSLLTRFTISYYQAVQNQIQYKLSIEKLNTFKELQRIVNERYKKGLASSLDVNLSESSLAFQNVTVENLYLQSKSTIQFIEVSLGKYPLGELQISNFIPNSFTNIPAGIPTDLLKRRPDVSAALLRVESSKYRINEAKKSLLPSFALTGSGGTSASELKNILNGDYSVFNLGSNIIFPIFQGGRLKANIRNAKNQLSLSEIEAMNKILITLQEVEQSLMNESSLNKQLSFIQNAVERSESAYNLAVNRYETGLTNLTTVLDSQQRWFDARQQKNLIEYQRLASRINFFLVLGGIFNVPIEEKN